MQSHINHKNWVLVAIEFLRSLFSSIISVCRKFFVRRYVVGIDIGGTAIQIGAFAVNQDGTLNPSAQYEREETTAHGLDEHIQQITRIIATLNQEIETENGFVARVGIASPGRFNASGCIKPDTSPNMGTRPNEFDEVNLQERYRTELETHGIRIPLVVRNDADAMLAGLIRALQQPGAEFQDQYGNAFTAADLKGNLIGYLGIGTGLGNSFSRDGVPVTDGHLSKVIISISEEDLSEFQRVYDQRGAAMQYFNAERREANLESLVCNPTLCVLAGVENSRDLDVNIEQHQTALALVGKYLARGMIAVQNGVIRDINTDNQWTAEEIEEARQTSVYLLGGGIMGSVTLAGAITAAAELTLSNYAAECIPPRKHGIRIVPMGCENPAVLAAALLLPASERLRSGCA
jgi:hypothetical protein